MLALSRPGTHAPSAHALTHLTTRALLRENGPYWPRERYLLLVRTGVALVAWRRTPLPQGRPSRGRGAARRRPPGPWYLATPHPPRGRTLVTDNVP